VADERLDVRVDAGGAVAREVELVVGALVLDELPHPASSTKPTAISGGAQAGSLMSRSSPLASEQDLNGAPRLAAIEGARKAFHLPFIDLRAGCDRAGAGRRRRAADGEPDPSRTDARRARDRCRRFRRGRLVDGR